MPVDKTVPNLENITPSGLIDMLGDLRIEKKRLEFLEGIYKQALESRCSSKQLVGAELIRGDKWIGLYKEVSQERINADLVRSELQDYPEILAKVTTVTTFKQLNTTLNPDAS